MDYDPTTQQYRERNNASWDRIRHENASSVRSEPADPSYFFNNYDYNADPFQELIPQQEVDNYVPHNHLLNLDYAPIIDNNLQPLQPLPPLQQKVDLEPIRYSPLDGAPLRIEEENEDEIEDSDSSDDDVDDEVDRPDVYCMECCSKVEDTDSHDIATCSKLNSQRYECNLCNEMFNFEKNMKVHKILEHSKQIDFVKGTACPFCQKEANRPTFSRYTAFIGHIKIHIKADTMNCEQCGMEFQNEKELDRHRRRDHSDEAYELSFCPKCQKIITLEDSAAHYLLHFQERKVERKEAENRKEAPPKTLLAKLQPKKPPETKRAKQRRPKPREKKHQCEECQKMFVRPAELARHAMIHIRKPKLPGLSNVVVDIPKWKCQNCDKEYSHKSGLLEHNKSAHGKAKQFVCQLCGMSFNKKSNHTRHIKKVHLIEKESKKSLQYECADCPAVYTTLGHLTWHKRAYHFKAQNKKVTKIIPIYERHICPICKREFRDSKMLEMHRRLHLKPEYRWRDVQGGGERKCDFCDKSFVLRASLIWHVQKHYEEQQEDTQQVQPFCTLCDLNFDTQQEFRQHQDEQHSVVCGSCHQKFSSRQVYEDHICNRRFASRSGNNALLPNNRVIICRQCRPPQRLTTARQIKEHRARHLPRKAHLCWTCHKSFRTAQLLSLHAEVHDRQPVQCAHCPQVFHSRVALKQHTRISHGGDTNYQCVVHVDRTMAMSAQSFAEYGLAADHNEQAHRAHSVTEWMDTEEEIIPQEQMEQDLRNQPLMQINPIMNQSTVSRAVNGAQDAPIRCEVCHHLYENIEMLCDHWQGSDTDTDHSYQIVTCPICETRTRGASEAANHLRNAHLFARPKLFQFMKPPDIIPEPNDSLALVPLSSSMNIPQSTVKKGHQCMECSKIFTRKNDLHRHIKIHTGEKGFPCPECSKSFRVKSTLKSHLATHSDNPPQFQCTVCQKGFYERKSLVVHMRIHTGEQPHKCRFCDLHFRTTPMVRTHEKKCVYGGPHRPILPDPSAGATSSFQPQYVAPQTDMDRTITQISSLPDQPLQLSSNSAFNTVQSMGEMATSGDTSIFVITKPITQIQYIVIVQKTKPLEGTMRYAVDTVSEIKIHQLQESTNLSIVLHNDMRLNLNTVKMLQLVPQLRIDGVFKTRVNVLDDVPLAHDTNLFTIIAHNNKTTSGVSSFIRRCEICEVDLPTKRASDAHFYSEDHETAQLMYPSKNQQQQQPAISVDRNVGMNNMMSMAAVSNEFNCKLCGSRFMDMDSLLNHIRREHDDEPVIPPRPVAHTAPIN